MPDAPPPALAVRRFQPGDGERIRELNERAMATTPEYVPDAPDDDLRAIPEHYLDAGGEFLVGTVDGDIVATGAYAAPNEWKAAYLDLADDTVELTRMRVAPDRHGQGVGTAVYRELERRARADGYRRFVLDTGVDNDAARGFYETLGFDRHREVSVDFEDLTIELALYENPIADAP